MTDPQGEYMTAEIPTPPPLPPYLCRHCGVVLARLTVADGKTALVDIQPHVIVITAKGSIILHCPDCGAVRDFTSVSY